MRSGTSMVAEVVHRLGFPVASFIPAPAPPSWRSDWEDANLTMHLMLGNKVHWQGYVNKRREMSRAMGFGGRIAIKSPYLALHYKEIERDIQDTYWIVCARLSESISRSMLAHPQLKLADQARIVKALAKITPDRDVVYEDFIQFPEWCIRDLERDLGLEPKRYEEVARYIGKPTEYPCLQSSPL